MSLPSLPFVRVSFTFTLDLRAWTRPHTNLASRQQQSITELDENFSAFHLYLLFRQHS
jgi:hypothetical protein